MFVVQHDLMNLSINIPNDDFREFVDTLVVALRAIDKRESPMAHIHPVIVREAGLAAVEGDE